MVWLIDDFFDSIVVLGQYITQALYTLINCVLYPIQLIFSWIGNIISIITDAVISLISSITITFSILYNFISNIFTDMMPALWLIIILLGLSIVFLLRIYYFLKDVHILGNSI